MRTGIVLLLSAALAWAQPAPKDRMVVVVSLDGFPGYALDDPALPVPTLRSLMRNGVSGRMATVNPTVTWPNHTSMVTGVKADEHGLLVNGTLTRTGAWPPVKIEPMLDKTRMVHARTVYDAAHDAGLTTAQVNWVAINNAPTIDWAFSEWAPSDSPVREEMIRKGVISAADVKDFTKLNIVWRDQIWTRAATYLIREHKPNLLLVHFLSLDSTHHQYGPKSLAAADAMAFLDGCVGQILAAIHETGMQDRATILVVSDHGFKPYTKEIHAATALREAGLEGKAHVVNEGGSALVYADKAALPQAIKTLEAVEGIDRVVGRDGFAALGLPLPERDPQMGDLFLTAKAGYSFAGASGGPVTAPARQTGGSHGYAATDPDMDAIFIASGYGIRGGANPRAIANIDVAPTIAKLLGVDLPSAKGKALPILTLR
ncbi:MAG TPA: ectonucleotide pyrophosphatase/phosphodiesterase [Candidatus Acidoferrales bacterium]|nr:ectonucleotide pyrophosphatase/phosphodiesterase [Candidatus Acidoferrales bacterium]